jgi:hypothetical protein
MGCRFGIVDFKASHAWIIVGVVLQSRSLYHVTVVDLRIGVNWCVCWLNHRHRDGIRVRVYYHKGPFYRYPTKQLCKIQKTAILIKVSTTAYIQTLRSWANIGVYISGMY